MQLTIDSHPNSSNPLATGVKCKRKPPRKKYTYLMKEIVRNERRCQQPISLKRPIVFPHFDSPMRVHLAKPASEAPSVQGNRCLPAARRIGVSGHL